MQRINIVKLHTAAFLFAEDPTRTAKELAKRVRVRVKTIYEWAKREEWHAALDMLKFEGDRRLNTYKRNSSDLIERARVLYLSLRADGMRKQAADKETAKRAHTSQRTIQTWRLRYNWE